MTALLFALVLTQQAPLAPGTPIVGTGLVVEQVAPAAPDRPGLIPPTVLPAPPQKPTPMPPQKPMPPSVLPSPQQPIAPVCPVYPTYQAPVCAPCCAQPVVYEQSCGFKKHGCGFFKKFRFGCFAKRHNKCCS
jgi:hypothetical protein